MLGILLHWIIALEGQTVAALRFHVYQRSNEPTRFSWLRSLPSSSFKLSRPQRRRPELAGLRGGSLEEPGGGDGLLERRLNPYYERSARFPGLGSFSKAGDPLRRRLSRSGPSRPQICSPRVTSQYTNARIGHWVWVRCLTISPI